MTDTKTMPETIYAGAKVCCYSDVWFDFPHTSNDDVPATPYILKSVHDEAMKELVDALKLWDAYDKGDQKDHINLMIAYGDALSATQELIAKYTVKDNS